MLDPQISLIDVSELYKIRRSTDIQALKLLNVVSGTWKIKETEMSMQGQKIIIASIHGCKIQTPWKAGASRVECFLPGFHFLQL